MSNNNVITLTIPAGDKRAALAGVCFFNALYNYEACSGLIDAAQETGDRATTTMATNEPAQPANTGSGLGGVGVTSEPAKVEAPNATPAAHIPEPTPQPEAEKPKLKPEDYPVEVNGVLLDSEGLPHDMRVDSSNKKCRKADGVWTPKRGVDKAEYKRVKDELRAAMQAGGQPQVQPDPEPQAQQQQATPVQQQQAPADNQAAYDAGSAFGGQQQQPQDQAPNLSNAAEFFRALSEAQFSDEVMQQVCTEYGWNNLGMAAAVAGQNANVFNEVFARLQQLSS